MSYAKIKQFILLIIDQKNMIAPFLLIFVIFFAWIFLQPRHHTLYDFKDMKRFDEVIFLTDNNYHSYFIDKNKHSGFEYELAKSFAKYLNVELKVGPLSDYDKILHRLKRNQRIILASSHINPENNKNLIFSDPYMEIEQNIITNRKKLKIKSIHDLDNQTIYIPKNSYYKESLQQLISQGIKIKIEEIENTSEEKLIHKVAKQNIDITIADSNIALLNRKYYPEIYIGLCVKNEYDLQWATRYRSIDLIRYINAFLSQIKTDGTFQVIYKKYYHNTDNFDYFDIITFHKRIKTRLPYYIDTIKTISARHNFDWRLIAAQIYQESHFDQMAKSNANAQGLMQLMYTTAKSHGVTNLFDPMQNINAGVKHLKYLFNLFNKAKGQDRLLISLAAYNIGQGHMLDARNLARKMGLDPNKWTSIAQALPLLTKPEYYKDSLYGYCRGTEPIKYINKIRLYYDILKHQTKTEFAKTDVNSKLQKI